MKNSNILDRKAAYKKVKEALANENVMSLEGLDLVIATHFQSFLTSKLVAIMQSGKRNIDDEVYELNRRCRLADIHWKFNQEGHSKDIVTFFQFC